MLCELKDGFFAQACVAAGDEDDFSVQTRDIPDRIESDRHVETNAIEMIRSCYRLLVKGNNAMLRNIKRNYPEYLLMLQGAIATFLIHLT